MDTETEERYFVATVHRWRGFYIPYTLTTEEVIEEVKSIREQIENDKKEIFENPKYFKENVVGALAGK
jgi:hypothetical protein